MYILWLTSSDDDRVLYYLRRRPIVGIGFAKFDCREHVRPEKKI